MRDVNARHPLAPGVAARAPLFVLSARAVASFGAVWHTLVQDFAVPIAGLIAAAQTIPLVAAVRWPMTAWVASAVALVVATVTAAAALDGVWPDPNLYVHLAVMFIAGMSSGIGHLAIMWLALVGSSVILVNVEPATIGAPGLAETIGLATTVLIAAAAVGAREAAVRQAGAQRRMAEDERIKAATLRERTRIARELHDVVAHHMSVIAVQAEAAPLRVGDPPVAMREAFTAIRRNAVEGLAELRRVVGVLRDTDDPVAPQPQLHDLDALIGNVRNAGLSVEAAVESAPCQLPPGLQLSAFRIMQEALNNVMRHAPGASARVTVAYTPDALKLAITNEAADSPRTAPGHGHGLVGMRERVTMLGGQLEAGPTTGGGYAVTALLPIEDQAQM